MLNDDGKYNNNIQFLRTNFSRQNLFATLTNIATISTTTKTNRHTVVNAYTTTIVSLTTLIRHCNKYCYDTNR